MMKARKAADSPPDDVEITQHIRQGLRHLLQAQQYADQLERDAWDFAVEISSLHQLGITRSDLRWLICNRYVEHACEVTLPGGDRRQFRRQGELTFTRRTCFVLTESGLELLKTSASKVDGSKEPVAQTKLTPNSPRHTGMVPTWDADRQQLRLGDVVVKEFKLPSVNQTIILTAFEEKRWPRRIDNPLPPCCSASAEQQLNETIHNLNQSHKEQFFRFSADADGDGVCWEFIRPSL